MDYKILEKREAGFYWVKIKCGKSERWTIAEYDLIWHYQGCSYEDINFIEIDEHKIVKS